MMNKYVRIVCILLLLASSVGMVKAAHDNVEHLYVYMHGDVHVKVFLIMMALAWPLVSWHLFFRASGRKKIEGDEILAYIVVTMLILDNYVQYAVLYAATHRFFVFVTIALFVIFMASPRKPENDDQSGEHF